MLIFETPRLGVREYTLHDDDAFHMLNGNEDVMRYIRATVTKDESDKLLDANVQQYSSLPNTGRWYMYEKASGNFVGSFSILVMDSDKSKIHIGYALLPQFWGKGYASEVLMRGIHYFFNNHSSDILYAITQTENTASQKVLIKSGFTNGQLTKDGEREILIHTLTRVDFIHK